MGARNENARGCTRSTSANLGAFEMAELEEDPDIRRAWLTFVVVGGGPTGVEIAGQIAELWRRALKHEFRRFDSGEVQVFLFEGGSEILATFGDRLSGKAAHELEKIGVKIHVNSIVTQSTRRVSTLRGQTGPRGTLRRRRKSGLLVSWHRLWRSCWRTPPARNAIGPAASKYNRTVHCQVTRRCS